MPKKKLLVANRSEIACRIFQGAREMGLKAVAMVAPGDEEARHVTYADEVVEIQSYLDLWQKCRTTCGQRDFDFF